MMDTKTLSMLLMPLAVLFISGSDGNLVPSGLYDVHVVGRICPDTAPNRYLTRYTDSEVYGRTIAVDAALPTDQHWSLVNSTATVGDFFFIFNLNLNEALMLTNDSETNGDGRVVRSVSVTPGIVHGATFVDLGAEYWFEFAEVGGNGDPNRGLIRHVQSGLVLQHRDTNSTVREGVFAVEHTSSEDTTTVTEGFCTCTYPPTATPGRWWRYFD